MVRKKDKTGSRYKHKLNTYKYILYRLKIKELSLLIYWKSLFSSCERLEGETFFHANSKE